MLLVSHSPSATEPIASSNNPFENVQAMTTKPLVLVLCTGDSSRSHLAKGILRQASGGLIEVSSAGLKHKFRREEFE